MCRTSTTRRTRRPPSTITATGKTARCAGCRCCPSWACGGGSDMRTLTLTLALPLAAGACTPDFQNITTIRDLRLLVVMAQPPEVLVDLPAWAAVDPADAPAVESQLPTFNLQALVMDPAGGGRPVEYQAWACGNDPLENSRNPTAQMGRVGATVAQAPCPAGSAIVAAGSVVPAADGSALLPVTFTPTLALLTAAVRT